MKISDEKMLTSGVTLLIVSVLFFGLGKMGEIFEYSYVWMEVFYTGAFIFFSISIYLVLRTKNELKNSKQRKLLIGVLMLPVLAFCFVAGLLIYWSIFGAPFPDIISTEVANAPIYTLGFVGDIMMDRGVKSSIKARNSTYNSVLSNITDTLQSYDLLFGNLEGPISNKGANQGSIYSFRMDPAVSEVLADNSFDVLSVANNHAFDWGPHAFMQTLELLAQHDIAAIGGGVDVVSAHTPHIETLSDGTTIAYLASSQFGKGYSNATRKSPGISVLDIGFLTSAMEILSEEYDVIIVSLHFGEEYEPLPNAYQQSIAKRIIDAGGDLVIGHHPHVVQPLEKYGGGYIAYSLGNFIFDQYFSKETMQGGLLDVSIQNGNIVRAEMKTTYQDKSYVVYKIE